MLTNRVGSPVAILRQSNQPYWTGEIDYRGRKIYEYAVPEITIPASTIGRYSKEITIPGVNSDDIQSIHFNGQKSWFSQWEDGTPNGWANKSLSHSSPDLGYVLETNILHSGTKSSVNRKIYAIFNIGKAMNKSDKYINMYLRYTLK